MKNGKFRRYSTTRLERENRAARRGMVALYVAVAVFVVALFCGLLTI